MDYVMQRGRGYSTTPASSGSIMMRPQYSHTMIFLVHLDLHLFLRRNAVEAASAGVTLDIDYAETVAGVLAYALECGECAGVDLWLKFFGVLAQTLFVLTCLVDDFVELGALLVEDVVAVDQSLLGRCYFGGLVVGGAGIFGYMLFGQLDLKRLELDFFRQNVVFAVVAHIVELLFVTVDFGFGVGYLLFFSKSGAAQLLDLATIVVDAGVETFDIVL